MKVENTFLILKIMHQMHIKTNNNLLKKIAISQGETNFIKKYILFDKYMHIKNGVVWKQIRQCPKKRLGLSRNC